MKCKTAKTVLFLILAALFLLRCEDVKNMWHPGDPVIPDGKSYTVSFNGNGGSGTAPDSIPAKSGESIRLPNAEGLSRTNYTFGGWNTSASGTGTNYAAGSSFTVPTQNFTLYAKWEAVGSSAVSVTGVSLNKTSLSLTVGASETLTATVSPSNATNKSVNWTSSNSAVATVSGGTVTAKSIGTATITVSTADGGKTAKCELTVAAAAVPVSGVSLNETSYSLSVGGGIYLLAMISPSNATNHNVSWKTSNSAVATLDEFGVTIPYGDPYVIVRTKSSGTATITVTTADGNKTATCALTVTDP